MKRVRGLTEHQEQDPRLLIRDTRTLGMRIHDFFQEPRNGAIVMLVAMVTVFFFSAIADFGSKAFKVECILNRDSHHICNNAKQVDFIGFESIDFGVAEIEHAEGVVSQQ